MYINRNNCFFLYCFMANILVKKWNIYLLHRLATNYSTFCEGYDLRLRSQKPDKVSGKSLKIDGFYYETCFTFFISCHLLCIVWEILYQNQKQELEGI